MDTRTYDQSRNLFRTPGAPSPSAPLHGRRPNAVRRLFTLTPQGFASATLAICLLLQRFALPAGDLKISIATPLVLGLVLWGLVSNVLAIDLRRVGLFLGLCAVALIAFSAKVNAPLAMAPRSSLPSLLYWMAVTAFAVIRFRQPLNETEFFRLVDRWILVVAVAGLLAFIVQFAGLTLFSFTGIVPDDLLIEEQYAVVIPMEGSSYLRANGFFLVEPSVFSQFVAVGIIVQWLYLRDMKRLGLYFAALFSSVSGTGWMILGAFVVVIGLTTGGKGVIRALTLSFVAIIAFTIVGLVLPDVTETMQGRIYEFSLPGTSGNERFVTPFMALSDVLHVAPWSLLTGIGPGASDGMTVPYKYWLNTPVKITLEYGVFGFLFYLGLFLRADRTKRQSHLMAPLIVFVMFTGGYQQFSPILFWVLLVGTVANLRPDEDPAGVKARSAVAGAAGRV